MKLLPLEDNWHDIVSKAMRGLGITLCRLAKESSLEEEELRSLLEEGRGDQELLARIAPILQLDPQALMTIFTHRYHPGSLSLPPNFRHFTTSCQEMQVNSYLLWSEESRIAVAFDTGGDATPLLKSLEEQQLQLALLLLTHRHSDHVCQLEKIVTTTGAVAWIHQEDLIAAVQPFTPPYLWRLDSSISIEARSTPGHSLGGTTYLICGTSPTIAVVGDALFAGSVGGIAPHQYQRGLAAIQNNILSLDAATILASGHGPLTTVGYEKEQNPFFASLLR
jgi:glyoxylase-like metal-dependent hydrolase (beta-lactamase superfamily II)